jgi:hypothetical protein
MRKLYQHERSEYRCTNVKIGIEGVTMKWTYPRKAQISCERKDRETSKVKHYISNRLHSREMISGESQKLVESN